jgi:hypothetical protein
MHASGGQGAVPEAREHERIGRLKLRKIKVCHGNENRLAVFDNG